MHGLVLRYNSPFPLKFEHAGDSGVDVRANEDVVIPVGGRMLVSTGLFLMLPYGYEAQIRSRSGLAHKFGVVVANSPGTVDNGYRGEVKINLMNHGGEKFYALKGDRIAQLVLSKVPKFIPFPMDNIDAETSRGADGHGSTGIK